MAVFLLQRLEVDIKPLDRFNPTFFHLLIILPSKFLEHSGVLINWLREYSDDVPDIPHFTSHQPSGIR